MTAVYILSTSSIPGEWKIGKHSGSRNQLISRYISKLHHVEIHHFIPTSYAYQAEQLFLYRYKEFRIKNIRDHDTEWLTLSADDIFEKVSAIISELSNVPSQNVNSELHLNADTQSPPDSIGDPITNLDVSTGTTGIGTELSTDSVSNLITDSNTDTESPAVNLVTDPITESIVESVMSRNLKQEFNTFMKELRRIRKSKSADKSNLSETLANKFFGSLSVVERAEVDELSSLRTLKIDVVTFVDSFRDINKSRSRNKSRLKTKLVDRFCVGESEIELAKIIEMIKNMYSTDSILVNDIIMFIKNRFSTY